MKYLLAIPVVCFAFAGIPSQAQADCTRLITLTNGTTDSVKKVKVSTRPRVGAFTKKKEWTSAPAVQPGDAMKIQVTTKVKCDVAVKWKIEFWCPSANTHQYSPNTWCSKYTTEKNPKRSLPANACSLNWTNC